MARTKARVDANQAEIVADLRAVGATVEHLHERGHGCPDITVGFRGANYLFEIKVADEGLSLTQHLWHEAWQGQVDVIRTSREAFVIMGLGWEGDDAEEEDDEGVDLDGEPYGRRRHYEEEYDEGADRDGLPRGTLIR